MGYVPKGATAIIGKEEMKLNKQVGEEDFVALETEGNLVGLQRVVSKESLCLENNKAGEKDNGPNKEYGLQLDTEVESGVGPNMIKTGNNSKLESEMKEEPKDKAWEPKRSCANVVDELVNSRMASKWNAQEVSILDAKIGREFDADLEERNGKQRKKKVMKFRSMMEIQNKSLTESERMKRDRDLKKRIWSKHYLEESELSGKSLSDSDINNRVSKLVNEAK
ncbi:hypothetical protein V6N13_075021 [Hibiscus sabdariffa]